MAPKVTGIKVAFMGSSESEELSGGNRNEKGPQVPISFECRLKMQDKPHCWEIETSFKHLIMAPEITCIFGEPDKTHTCTTFPCTDPDCKNREGAA